MVKICTLDQTVRGRPVTNRSLEIIASLSGTIVPPMMNSSMLKVLVSVCKKFKYVLFMSCYYYLEHFILATSCQKSLTLPANQTPPSGQHKRSLSESKTFEMVKSQKQRYQDKLDMKLALEVAHHRQRNNSTTESTTSGVSSCESVLGGKSVIK